MATISVASTRVITADTNELAYKGEFGVSFTLSLDGTLTTYVTGKLDRYHKWLGLIDETSGSGWVNPGHAMVMDDQYIYIGGDTTQKVYQLAKSNLAKVAESDDCGGTIYSICYED